MADDVCESWEDLEKSEVLNRKLEQLKLNGDPSKKKPVKILQRPSSNQDNSSPGSAGSKSPARGNGGNGKPSLNANVEPFVPKGAALLPTPTVAPNVEIEGSTRTQYQPKLVILKRDKNSDSKSNDKGSGSGSRPSPLQKSYEEREADYKKARERILGSADPVPLLSTPPNVTPIETSPRSTTAPTTIRPQQLALAAGGGGQPEVPLVIQQPQGPIIDGGKGFLQRTKR